MIEIKILNNFKNLFIAIKNKTKLEDNNYLEGKTFEEKMIEKLKSLSPKRPLKHSTKEIYTHKKKHLRKIRMNNNINYIFNLKKMETIKEISSSKIIKNKKEKMRITRKKEKKENFYKIDDNKAKRKSIKVQTILNININSKHRLERGRIERLKTSQPSSFSKLNLIDNYENKENRNINLDNFNIQKEYKLRIKNILEMIQQYDDIEDYIAYYKLLFEKDNNSIENIMRRKQIKENIIHLNYYKNYNKILNSKYNLLKCQNDDYSFFLLIYNNINEI